MKLLSDRRLMFVLALSILVTFFVTPTFAQMNTAYITGTVVDPSGSIVPRANITAVQKRHPAKAHNQH